MSFCFPLLIMIHAIPKLVGFLFCFWSALHDAQGFIPASELKVHYRQAWKTILGIEPG